MLSHVRSSNQFLNHACSSQALYELGAFLANHSGLCFSKDKIRLNLKERTKGAQEPWRALYGWTREIRAMIWKECKMLKISIANSFLEIFLSLNVKFWKLCVDMQKNLACCNDSRWYWSLKQSCYFICSLVFLVLFWECLGLLVVSSVLNCLLSCMWISCMSPCPCSCVYISFIATISSEGHWLRKSIFCGV